MKDADLAFETMSATANAISRGDESEITRLSYDLARDIARGLMIDPRRPVSPSQRAFLVAAKRRATVDA